MMINYCRIIGTNAEFIAQTIELQELKYIILLTAKEFNSDWAIGGDDSVF